MYQVSLYNNETRQTIVLFCNTNLELKVLISDLKSEFSIMEIINLGELQLTELDNVINGNPNGLVIG